MIEKIKLSILITHYNRPSALEECISAIRELNIHISYEIVVSDDGSDAKNLDIVKTFQYDQLIVASENSGLAANINRGLEACQGKYIIYCQEDFLLTGQLSLYLKDIIKLIDNKKLDMIRLYANYDFPILKKIDEYVSEIPKFRVENFLVNAFQYSDNPFLTTKEFYVTYGNYLEGTRSDYGEAEFAIRIFKSKARIGIVNKYCVRNSDFNSSVTVRNPVSKFKKHLKRWYKLLRAIRLHIEMLLYNPKNRTLKTYSKT